MEKIADELAEKVKLEEERAEKKKLVSVVVLCYCDGDIVFVPPISCLYIFPTV